MKPAWVVSLVVLLAAVSAWDLGGSIRGDAARAERLFAQQGSTLAPSPPLEPALGALAPVVELVRREVSDDAVVFTATDPTREGLLAVHVLRSLAWPRHFIADGTFGPGWRPAARFGEGERWLLELSTAPRSPAVLAGGSWELAHEGSGYLLWRSR